jgi:hypothetical protein
MLCRGALAHGGGKAYLSMSDAHWMLSRNFFSGDSKKAF